MMAPQPACSFLEIGTTYTKHKRYMYTSSKHSPKACHRRSYDAPPRDRGYQRKWSIFKFTEKINKNGSRENDEKVTHEDDDSEPTSREEQVDPRLDLSDLHVEAGRNDTGLVQTTV